MDPIIHGDLTGVSELFKFIFAEILLMEPAVKANILINATGTACLCDFGLSMIIAEFHGTSYYTSTITGSVRWSAPELYQVQDGVTRTGLSMESDVYSFGSVMLQVRDDGYIISIAELI